MFGLMYEVKVREALRIPSSPPRSNRDKHRDNGGYCFPLWHRVGTEMIVETHVGLIDPGEGG